MLILACAACDAGAAVIQTSLDTLVPGGAQASGIVIGGYRFSEFTFRNSGPFDVSADDVSVRVGNNDLDPTRMDVQLGFGADAAAPDWLGLD